MKTSQRAVKYFGDILPAAAFEHRPTRKSDTAEICRLLAKECGIYHKPLVIKGERSVTE